MKKKRRKYRALEEAKQGQQVEDDVEEEEVEDKVDYEEELKTAATVTTTR
jgi:peptide chain release factor